MERTDMIAFLHDQSVGNEGYNKVNKCQLIKSSVMEKGGDISKALLTYVGTCKIAPGSLKNKLLLLASLPNYNTLRPPWIEDQMRMSIALGSFIKMAKGEGKDWLDRSNWCKILDLIDDNVTEGQAPKELVEEMSAFRQEIFNLLHWTGTPTFSDTVKAYLTVHRQETSWQEDWKLAFQPALTRDAVGKITNYKLEHGTISQPIFDAICDLYFPSAAAEIPAH